jgi:hypothetical protein
MRRRLLYLMGLLLIGSGLALILTYPPVSHPPVPCTGPPGLAPSCPPSTATEYDPWGPILAVSGGVQLAVVGAIDLRRRGSVAVTGSPG